MEVTKKNSLILFFLCIAGMIHVAVALVEEVNEQSTVIADHLLPSVQIIEKLHKLTAELRIAESVHIISTDIEEINEQDNIIKLYRIDIEHNIDLFKKLFYGKEYINNYYIFYKEYDNYLIIQEKLLNLSRDNKNTEARELFLSESQKSYNSFSDKLNSLSTLSKESAISASHYGDRIYKNIKMAEFFIIITMLILMVIVMYMEIKSRILQQKSIKNRVIRALKSNSFHCSYQPIVDLCSGEILGVEMLARLDDKLGTITPDQFIPIILETDNSWFFTQMIVEQSLTELNTLNTIPQDFKISFNIFPSDISSGFTSKLINFQGIKEFPGKIVLEIIENEVLTQQEAQQHIINLSEQGFLIAIDDFGTGYSNLSQLEAISADFLKIDRSFVSDVDAESIKSSLIPHIVTIANKVGMKIIAEGIENYMQHQELREMGVEQGQGWHFGKPVLLDELRDYLGV